MKKPDHLREQAIAAEHYYEEREYWLNQLAGELEKTCFPGHHNNGNLAESTLKQISIQLPGDVSAMMMKLSGGSDAMLYMILAAALVLLLHKYTGSEDIIIGSPVQKQEVEGEFINTALALRTRVRQEMTFKQLLLQTREVIVKANENQNYPIDTLAYQLNKTAQGNGFPLFDIAIVYQNVHDKRYLDHIALNMIYSFLKTGETIHCNLEYNSAIYKEENLRPTLKHFFTLLQRALANVNAMISNIDILTGQERKQLLYDFNQADREFPGFKTIHQLFQEQVNNTGHHIAGVYKDKKITYQELNKKANALARVLKKKGVTPGAIVGIMVERSIRMLAGILAILKAGGAYLPLDPDYPRERIRYILRDSALTPILTQKKFLRHLENPEDNYDLLNLEADDLYVAPGQDLEQTSCSNSLAYIIYTSGSTGRPKGVEIQHRSIVNTLLWRSHYYRFDSTDITLQVPSCCFDSSVEDIFSTLISGARLVLIQQEKKFDVAHLSGLIEKENVTHFLSVPLLYKHLLSDYHGSLKRMRCITIAGETFKEDLLLEHSGKLPGVKLYNEYGPTENSVCSTVYPFPADGTCVYIGKPIANTQLYIIGPALALQPVGLYGELCIAGAGLAPGYLNNPELTAEKFVKNPFVKYKRMYRSGDLARWLPDGNIEFSGRIDHQAKIRGFRVELGEIETRLVKHNNIKEAVVVSRSDTNGSQYLCAYITAAGSTPAKVPPARELKTYLSRWLPDYMIPSYFATLERIPLTSHGKVDRKTLPEPVIKAADTYTAPRCENEKKLAAIWAQVLNIKENTISIDDNFFDLGGHSLKAALLMAKIHKAFNINLPLSKIFTAPTIRELALFTKEAVGDRYVSINPVEKKEYYAVSSAQKRLYILQQLDEQGQGIGYNIPSLLSLEGDVDKARLEQTLKRLIQRHESLRTSFEIIATNPVQRIHHEVEFNIQYENLDQGQGAIGDPATRNPQPATRFIANFIRPFDLSGYPLLRVGLIKTRPRQYIMMVDMHHIVSDGISTGVLVEEFMAFYEGQNLPGLRIQYKDFSAWQNSLPQQEKIQQQEAYWLEQFDGEVPVLSIPVDYPRPRVYSFEGNQLSFDIHEQQTRSLNSLAKEQGATLFMVLLALYTILLAKLSQQEDIAVGTPIAGRRHADLQQIIGMFVNTLVLRNFPKKEKNVNEFLAEVKDRTLQTFSNQDYPYEALVERITVPRDTSRNPLFDTMFDLLNIDIPAIEIPGLKVKPYNAEYSTAKFDLSLQCNVTGESIRCTLQYSTKLFKEETMRRLITYFKKIVSSVIHEPGKKLWQIEMMQEEEKREILYDFNDTAKTYPGNKTIQQLVEEQVERTPDRTALMGQILNTFDETHISYRELNKKSIRLAHLLREKGTLADSIVAIMVERSVEMIAVLLAVIKAGGAYLPIDPGYPGERIAYMLKDSNTNILLTTSTLEKVKKLKSLDVKNCCEIIFINDVESPFFSPSYLLNFSTSSSSLAYVIYTSGSTGRPKGVMVQHDNFVNAAFTWRKEYQLDQIQVNLLQMASFSFDVFAGDLARVLINGGKMVLCPQDVRLDPPSLYDLIRRQWITLFESTPSLVTPFMEYVYKNKLAIDNLQLLIVGSDTFRMEDFKNLLQRFGQQMRIINSYGVTEATIDSSYYETSIENMSSAGNVPIGRPMPNMTFYILDIRGMLQPVAIPGELCIGGAGVSRGYLNRPALTAERFIPWLTGRRRQNLYKTGDLAKWQPDGNIQFLGRIDRQVKIRGYRIEPLEIENRLLNHPHIKETVVIAKKEQTGETYLCAYIAARHREQSAGRRDPGPVEIDTGKLRQYLLQILPDYMIPAYFMPIEKIPVTPHGKIDRVALPEPEVKASARYTAPSTPIEKQLVELWSQVLGIKIGNISIDDNFFQLGGHSLKATNLVSRIYRAFHIKVPLVEIFNTPLIRELAKYIHGARKAQYQSIESVEKKEYYPLSSAQKRLYILQQIDPASTAYHLPYVLPLEENLDKEKLKKTFHWLVRRHEIFRTSFHMINGQPVQKIHEIVVFKIEYDDLTTEEGSQAPGDSWFTRPFDLSRAPLLRVKFIQTAKDTPVLLVDMHHVISDEVSQQLLIQDFMTLYDSKELPFLKLHYKDFAQWQNNRDAGEILKKQEAYWLKEFQQEPPLLHLPYDYQRPDVLTFQGDSLRFDIPPDLVLKVKQLAAQMEMTLRTFLIGVYGILLFCYTGQEEVVVGSAVSGRNHPDLEKIIGFFVNLLAIKTQPTPTKHFSAYLMEVKEKTMKAYENQDLQFEELINKLDIKRHPGRHPLVETAFELKEAESPPGTGNPGHQDNQDNNQVSYYHRVSHFDLILSANVTDDSPSSPGSINMFFEFSTVLFKTSTIREFANTYVEILEQITADPYRPLSEIKISHHLLSSASPMIQDEIDDWGI